jgi:hypothetical protein
VRDAPLVCGRWGGGPAGSARVCARGGLARSGAVEYVLERFAVTLVGPARALLGESPLRGLSAPGVVGVRDCQPVAEESPARCAATRQRPEQ